MESRLRLPMIAMRQSVSARRFGFNTWDRRLREQLRLLRLINGAVVLVLVY